MTYGGFKKVTAFANALGLSGPQQIYDIQSGKTKSISAELAAKIFLVFPEVNQEWVLKGGGEMMSSRHVQVGGSNFGRIQSDNISLNQDSVQISSADVRELISQNGKLIDIIKELTKKQ